MTACIVGSALTVGDGEGPYESSTSSTAMSLYALEPMTPVKRKRIVPDARARAGFEAWARGRVVELVLVRARGSGCAHVSAWPFELQRTVRKRDQRLLPVFALVAAL